MNLQLVLHDNSFLSLLKTAIIKEVRGFLPVHEKASIIAGGVKANDYPLKRLLLEWEWKNEKPKEISLLSNAVNLALKHKDCDYDLIIKVLTQALRKGYEFILSQNSFEAKRFFNLVREVRDEFYRARMFTKFINKDNYLIGLFQFEHDIIELVLQFFQKKFDKELLIVSKGSYYALKNNELVEFQPLIAK